MRGFRGIGGRLAAAIALGAAACGDDGGGSDGREFPPLADDRCPIASGKEVNFDPDDEPCSNLSSYRFFVGLDAAALQPNRGLLPYDLATPLFTDYAIKPRFVYLPPGTSAIYREDDALDFPVGTALIKNFLYVLDQTDADSPRRLIETRLLVHRSDGWEALPYLWSEDQSDAQLMVAGRALDVAWLDPVGNPQATRYRVPNKNQCSGCHQTRPGKLAPIGPKARHLNKTFLYEDGAMNQLARWTEAGLLEGAPVDPDDAPRSAVMEDSATFSLEQRARSYLDSNCAHCHSPTGAARSSGLWLDIRQEEPTRLGVCKSPVAAGRGSCGLQFSVVPGEPDNSFMVCRMSSNEPGIMMPELGRTMVHHEGVELIREWIAALEGSCGN